MLERYLHRSILLYTIVLSSGASGEMIYPELRDLGYLMPRQCARMISDTVVVGSQYHGMHSYWHPNVSIKK